MSRSSSESDRHTSREQMGRELVETGIARGQVHGSAPILLFDVLVGQVGVPVGVQRNPCADRDLVTRALGEQRRYELRRRGAGVIQISAAQLDFRVVLVLGTEPEAVRVLVPR